MSTLAHRNLRVAVCISPSLPSSIVSDAETRELIDRTADVVPAYTLDKGFYWLTSMAKALGLQDSRELLSRSFTSNHLPCGIGGEQTLWNIFKSPRWRDITRYIEDKGLAVFHQSSKTVRYLAQYREPAFAPSVSAF